MNSTLAPAKPATVRTHEVYWQQVVTCTRIVADCEAGDHPPGGSCEEGAQRLKICLAVSVGSATVPGGERAPAPDRSHD